MAKSRNQQNQVTSQQLAEAYAELELSPGATLDQVKAAYRQLARALHPDRNPGLLGSHMARVNRSYQILARHLAAQRETAVRAEVVQTSPHHRSAGRADMQPSVRPAAFFSPLSPVLEASPAAAFGDECTVAPALAGCRLKGVVSADGSLVYQVEVSGNPASMRLPLRCRRTCQVCGGSGVVTRGARRSHCSACGGRGVIVSAEGMEVSLPKTWRAGQRLAVPCEGGPQPVWVELSSPSDRGEV